MKMSFPFEGFELMKQGAEARIYKGTYCGKPAILKERFKKAYRHPELDETLTKERIKAEARALARCRVIGIHTPAVYYVDCSLRTIIMEYFIDGKTLKEYIEEYKSCADSSDLLNGLLKTTGSLLAQMHKNSIIHGDLTTSNILVLTHSAEIQQNNIVFIDFGLSYVEAKAEDKGVDLYVLERAFLSTHPESEGYFKMLLDSYSSSYGKGAAEVLKKLDEVRMRGRKRTMVG